MCTRARKNLHPRTGISELKSEGLERDVARGLLLVGLLIGVLLPLRAGAQKIRVTETLTAPNPENDGEFGASLEAVGDLNGDGTPDLLVGGGGRAYVFDGAGGELLRTLTSPNSGGQFVSSLTGVGDVTGDGTPDLLVGGGGRAYVFDGAEGELLHTLTSPNPEDGGYLGYSLAGVGDVNGDGTPDLLVGAREESPAGRDDAGRAYVFDGAGGEVLDTLTSPNPEKYGWFGSSPAAVGDLSGDGTPDLVVGAESERLGVGRAYVFDGAGGEVLHTLTSPNPDRGGASPHHPTPDRGGHFGHSLAGVGDVNGDGTPDLLVGARGESPGDTPGAGRAYLFDGAEGEVLRTLTAPNPEGGFGESLASVGDVTGDGTPDLLVGAPSKNGGGIDDAGRAYLFDGAGGELLHTLSSPNPEEDGHFGHSLTGVGDVTGEGIPDLLVGAEDESPGGTEEAGRVYRFDVQRPPAGAQDESSSSQYLRANEETILSFETQGGKTLTIAQDTAGAYLVYRYGTSEQIELEFPSAKTDSWSKFQYYASSNSGGAADSTALYFERKDTGYLVYERTEAGAPECGVKVKPSGRAEPIVIACKPETMEGDLGTLREVETLERVEAVPSAYR